MLFSKKNKFVVPQYIQDKMGQIVGVRMGNKNYRIAVYDLMMNTPGEKSIYLYDNTGKKIAWDIKSFNELDDMLKTSFQA